MVNYNVLKNEKFGRYMVASRKIKTGELILSEKPILIGPQLNGPLICFNCCRNVDQTGYIYCRLCDTAILCGPKCIGLFHNEDECLILKKSNIIGEIFERNKEIAFPLRCILLRQYNPEIWKTVLQLEPHLESRRNTLIWMRYKKTIDDIIKTLNILSEEDQKNEIIQTVCGILDVNTFEIRPPTRNLVTITNPEKECLRGLYLNAALMAHDCVGNTFLSADDDFILTIKASIDIPEGTPIFFNYSNVLHGTLERRQHLREGKYFDCLCIRCLDNTELGTEISSLKCHKCSRGLIRLKNPNDMKSDWQCCNCKKMFKDFLIKLTIEEARRMFEELDNNVFVMEKFYNYLLKTFHRNHYLMLELKQNLVGLYMQEPPNINNLSRKIRLCQEMEEVISKLEPGLSRLKAITLYQLQNSCVDLTHKQYQNKDIDIDKLISKLIAAESKLKEAVRCLLYEPSKSPEGRISQMAMTELKMLRLSVANIQRDYASQIHNPRSQK